jgi:hypothetical protein
VETLVPVPVVLSRELWNPEAIKRQCQFTGTVKSFKDLGTHGKITVVALVNLFATVGQLV